MRRLAIAVLAVLLAFTFVSCGSDAPTGYAADQTVEAYSYVHGGYVGKAVVKTSAEGGLDVEINEAFMPHTLAIVSLDDAQWTEENTAYYVSRGNQVRVAKYVDYAGTVYVGVTVGGALVYVAADESGAPAGASSLEMDIIKNETTMAAYFNGIANGAFKIMTEFGGNATPVTTTSYGSLYKRGSGYWTNGMTWLGNMTAIEEFAEENGVAYGLSEMVRRDDNKWALADAVSAATASDFRDYFALIQKGVARLKMQ